MTPLTTWEDAMADSEHKQIVCNEPEIARALSVALKESPWIVRLVTTLKVVDGTEALGVLIISGRIRDMYFGKDPQRLLELIYDWDEDADWELDEEEDSDDEDSDEEEPSSDEEE